MKKVIGFGALLMALLLALSPGLAEAPAVYDPDFETLQLEDGLTLRYAVLGDPADPPVVLIHGATDSYYSFAQVAPVLAEAGYSVYVPELRGHGGSDKPEEGPYTLAQHVADMAELLSALELDRPFVGGHSLGSFVAQSLTAEHGQELGIRGLVLIGSAATTVDNPTLDWMLQGDEEFPGVAAFAEGVPEAFIDEWVMTDNEDEEFARHIRENALALPAYSWIHTFYGLEDTDNTGALGRIEVPVLILWGSEDAFFSEEDQEALQEALSASDYVRWVTLEGAGHNTHWDAGQLTPVTQAMLTFFAAQP